MIRVLALTALLFAFAAPAKATTIEVTQVIDATLLGDGVSPGGLYTGAPFTVSVGDTLIVNFSFLPGQVLSVLNLNVVGMGAEAADFGTPSQTSITAEQQNSLAFLALQGPAHDPLLQSSTTSGYGIGSFFYQYDFLDGTAGTVTFTGLQFGITILSYSDNVTQREYSGLDLFIQGDAASVIAVPEPSQGLLLFAGLGVLGYAVRRRLSL